MENRANKSTPVHYARHADGTTEGESAYTHLRVVGPTQMRPSDLKDIPDFPEYQLVEAISQLVQVSSPKAVEP